MAKFYGPIGYAVTEETTPGVWEDRISERMYFGELVRNTRRLQTADKLNDNINVSNEISILADRKYLVTVIDKNPDSSFIDIVAKLPTCRFVRHYKSDNLNHYVFTLYF